MSVSKLLDILRKRYSGDIFTDSKGYIILLRVTLPNLFLISNLDYMY